MTCILENAKMIIPIRCLNNFVHPTYLSIIVSAQRVYLESSSLHTVILLQHSQLVSTFSSWHHVTIVFTVCVTFPLQSLETFPAKQTSLTLIVWLRSWIVGTWLNRNNSVGARRASQHPSVIVSASASLTLNDTHNCPFSIHVSLSTLDASKLCSSLQFKDFPLAS